MHLHFPSLKSPTARIEDKVQMPVILTQNKNLKKLLNSGSGMMVLAEVDDYKGNTSFHLPVEESWGETKFTEFQF